jgi:hypothetical protein
MTVPIGFSEYVMKPLLLNRNIVIEETQNILVTTQMLSLKHSFIFMDQIKD